ncbi:MAG: hypothetical protein O3C21_12845, partial [Verrucomicrobia bacterium]|nr:hypothetical protein [Verrucomicrobiota bacterium]
MKSDFKLHVKEPDIKGADVRFISYALDIDPDFHTRFANIIRDKEKQLIEECEHVRIGGLERALTTAWRSYNVLQFGFPETDTFREIL